MSQTVESPPFVHPTTSVSPEATVGPGTQVWDNGKIREGAVIGANCRLGFGVYIDTNVRIGDSVKIQNGVSVYEGVTIEDGVFIGPNATLTNDRYPRACKPDGTPKNDWPIASTVIKRGASIGAAAVIVCGVTIGEWAMVGSGAVVTRDVPPQALVLGVPARVAGYVCRCGMRASRQYVDGWWCGTCRS